MRRLFLLCLVVLGISAVGPGAQAALAAPSARGDFNGDGHADLAVGVPLETIGSVGGGAVNVLYGSPTGLSATGNQLWHQDSAGVLDAAEGHENFGSALAAGDFNGDGWADLAVGAEFEGVGSVSRAGAVNVLYGSPTGLSATGNQFWHQDSAGVLDTAETFDRFGQSLVAGDFNADGRADLAVSALSEDIGSISAGAVNVLYGSAAGLSATGNQFWHQNSAGVLDAAEQQGQFGDFFGNALAVGDFNGDGPADLAVGVMREHLGTISDAGAVNVLYGSPTGLSATGNQFWHQNSAGVLDAAEADDRFGFALAGGDFNGDGPDDLAVGVRFEGINAEEGAVNVLYGTATGLSAAGNQFWDQDSPNIPDDPQGADWFGSALAAGDFNGDERTDLAVGVPGENVRTFNDGSVNVLYGSSAGLSATGNQFWHQDSAGIFDNPNMEDVFGGAVAAGDLNGDGRGDLAVGASLSRLHGEDVGTMQNAGAVNVIYGSATGLSASGNQFWHQGSPGVLDVPERSDHFGSALASGEAAPPA